MYKLISYVALVFLLGCSQEQESKPIVEVKLVKSMTVASSSGTDIRKYPGVVEALESAEMSFKVGGTLANLPLTPGMEISKGATIAQLDDKDFKINLSRAESSYALAQSQLKRIKELHTKNLVSQLDLDTAQSEFKTAEANFFTAKNELEYSQLKAPFDLTVAQVHVENFEQVSPTQPIATVHNFTSFNISIQVPQNIMAKVQDDVSNYQPDVTFDASPDKVFKASLREWVTNKGSSSDTYKVLFTLPAPEELNLLPGMTAEVKVDLQKIISSQSSLISIPLTALFSSDGNESGRGAVWIINSDMTLQKRNIRLGKIIGDQIEIHAGLKSGEKIVTAGVNRLSAGTKVAEWQKERGL